MAEAFLYEVGGGGSSLSLGSISISSNGTYLPSAYSLDAFDKVDVNIDISAQLSSAIFAANGTYTASQFGTVGFNTVTVSVPEGAVTLDDTTRYYLKMLTSYTDLSITQLRSEVFSSQYMLTSLCLPAVKIVRASAFVGTGISDLYLPELINTGADTVIFRNMFYLTSLCIPKFNWGMTYFYGCSLLESLTMFSESSPTETSIYTSAFYNCTCLKYISSLRPISTILSGAFYSCYGLNEFVNSNVKSIANAFVYCNGLLKFSADNFISTTTNIFPSTSKILELYISKFSKVFSSTYFGSCSKLIILNAPSIFTFNMAVTAARPYIMNITSTTAIQMSSARCSVLNIPYVSSLSSYMLAECKRLRTVYLSNCSIISGYAFSGCSGLASLYLQSTTVVTLQTTNAFVGTPITTANPFYSGYSPVFRATIYVPSSLFDSYTVATNWITYSSLFSSIID